MSCQDIQRLRYVALTYIDLQNKKPETRWGLPISLECRKLLIALIIAVLSATAAVSGTAKSVACCNANINNAAARLPLPAPVGHRQPRSNDVPPEDQASVERDRWLDKELDRKLHICRGC
jgi:hypothetical protein